MRKSLIFFIHLFSANTFSQLVGILALIYYTRVFSKIELALLPAAMMIGGISNLFFNFGFFPTLIKKIPSLVGKNDTLVKKLFATVFLFSLISGILVFLISYFFSSEISLWIFKNTEQKQNIKILSFSFIFFGLWKFFSYVFRSLSKFKELSKLLVVQNLTRIIFIVILSFFLKEKAIIIGVFFSVLFPVVIAFYLLRKYFIPFEGFYDFKNLIKESMPFYLEGYIMYFQREGDNLIISSILGAESLSIYFIAKKIYLFVYGALSSLGDVLTSQMSKFKNNISEYESKLSEIINTYVYIIIPVGLYSISFAPYLLKYVAGEKFYSAVLPGTILAIVPFIQFFFGLSFGLNVFLLDRSIRRMQYTFLNSIIMLLFLFIFGFSFALWGIVIGRMLTPIVSGYYVVYLSKRLHVLFPIEYSKLIKVIIFSVLLFCVNFILFINQLGVFYIILLNIVSLVFSMFFIHIFFQDEFYSSLSTIINSKINDPVSLIKWKFSK